MLCKLGVPALGADLLQALARQGPDGRAPPTNAVLGVGTVSCGRFARLRCQALDDVAEQKRRPLIQTDNRELRVEGPAAKGETGFEALHVLVGNWPDAPLAL